MNEEEHTKKAEAASLQLVRDVREDLVHALNSLGGHQSAGAIENFVFYSASQMNKAADGYVALRQTGRVDASKLLVRPMIEVMFRLNTAARTSELFYRLILTERLKRRDWLKGLAKRQGKDFDGAEEARQWETFRTHCIAICPASDLNKEQLSLRAAAKEAGLLGYYDSAYALYCIFTHGGFEAVMGLLNPISDSHDNGAVALCVFSAIEVLVPLGGESPNFQSLQQRMRTQQREDTKCA